MIAKAIEKFDYRALDSETRVVVHQKTTEIRDRMSRAAQAVVEIGQRLLDVKAALKHGQFGDWLEREFQWSEQSANNMMSVARTFKSLNFGDLKVSASALYLLASPSTPEDIRAEFIEKAEAGEAVKHADVRHAVAERKHSQAEAPTTFGTVDEDAPKREPPKKHNPDDFSEPAHDKISETNAVLGPPPAERERSDLDDIKSLRRLLANEFERWPEKRRELFILKLRHFADQLERTGSLPC